MAADTLDMLPNLKDKKTIFQKYIFLLWIKEL